MEGSLSHLLGLLQWFADWPHNTSLGQNPADGGYYCIVDLEEARLSWGIRQHKFVEGHGDTPAEAIAHARQQV